MQPASSETDASVPRTIEQIVAHHASNVAQDFRCTGRMQAMTAKINELASP